MPDLITQPHFHPPAAAGEGAGPGLPPYAHGDAFYDQLISAHRGLSDADSRLLNARLILLLANHIGDLQVLGQALAAARAGVAAAESR